ncbi:MAG: MmgE/PrpD family protein [Desulfurococcales archaeon]|nr:MmgE/PrpD family protein [Desulfurococcales archaeon]
MAGIAEAVVDDVLGVVEAGDWVLGEARKALIDTLAVAAAAPRVYPKALRIASAIAGGEPGPIPILGSGGGRAPRLAAALANAFLAHSIEFDDWLAPGYVHAGSIAIPVVLSYGYDSSLREVLQAIAAGYEAGLKVGSYMGRSHYLRYHGTATIGSVVAATVYTMLVEGPSRRVLEAAITLAASYMGGLWSVNRAGALYKPLSPAKAVETGVLAAKAALVEGKPVPGGIERACQALYGDCRYIESYRYGVAVNGYKFYPSCRHSHTVIEAALELYGRVKPGEIKRIRARLYREAVEVAGIREPRGVEEARFSIPYLVAAALVYGRVGFREIEGSLRDPMVHRLARLVELEAVDEYTGQYPARQPAELVIQARGGTLSSYRDRPRGEPGSSVSMDEILEKVEGLREYMDPVEYSVIRRLASESLETTLGEAFEALWAER